MSARKHLTALVVAAALCATPALAYRPPARVLLQKAMERQFDRATKSLRIDAETQTYEISGALRGAPIAERLMFQAPASMRRESDYTDGAHVEVRVDDKMLMRMPGQPDKAQKAVVDLLMDQVSAGPPLDDDKAVERILRDMKVLGVNPEVVSFARFDGRVAYLIGSKPWENDKPQMWLDKDTLLLVRVVIVTKGTDNVLKRTDVRYLGWGSPVGGSWFPSSIEVWSDDHIVRRSTIRNVERNVAFDATLFSVR